MCPVRSPCGRDWRLSLARRLAMARTFSTRGLSFQIVLPVPRRRRYRHTVWICARANTATAADQGGPRICPGAGEPGIDIIGQIRSRAVQPLIGGGVALFAFEGIGIDANIQSNTLFLEDGGCGFHGSPHHFRLAAVEEQRCGT
uniref:Uncharacterized protein ORF1 n=1 Tax=Agrobacterium tumefaciens TaxID=358 RepID=Q44189_AGRTU|nr:unknown [Agrobacterium tumefaciens]